MLEKSQQECFMTFAVNNVKWMNALRLEYLIV